MRHGRTEPWSAVVLAAGAGERLGGVPKPLIRVDGETLVGRLIAALRRAHASEIVITLGHHAGRVGAALPADAASGSSPPTGAAPLRSVHLDPPGDQAASLRAGLRALGPRTRAVLVCLADQPLIDAAALSAVHAAWLGRPAGCEMLVPQCQGTPGNPVMLSRDLADLLASAEPPIAGKDWRHANPRRVYHWVTPNAAYRTDLDGPADLATLRAQGLDITLPAPA